VAGTKKIIQAIRHVAGNLPYKSGVSTSLVIGLIGLWLAIASQKGSQ